MKENNLKKEKKVPFGIWTPNAKVLCYECHGKIFPGTKYNTETGEFEDKVLDEKEFEDMNTSKTIKDGYAVTKCNKCQNSIQLHAEVAHENNLVEILKEVGIEAYMAQTGGMNSATEIPVKDKGFIWITYNVCGEDEWLLGTYDEEGDFMDESYETKDLKELLEYIFKLRKNNVI